LTWSGSPTLDRSSQRIQLRRKSSLNRDDDADSEDGFGDEFDDFEEGAQAGEDDDFGDFDDGFEGPSEVEEVSQRPPLLQNEPQPTFVSRPCSNSSVSLLLTHVFVFLLMLIFW
jgi:Domain of unknown function (DUF5102)